MADGGHGIELIPILNSQFLILNSLVLLVPLVVKTIDPRGRLHVACKRSR